MTRKIRLRTVGVALALLALLGAGLAALVVLQGWYSVAATKQHSALVYRFLDLAMYESVKAHASGAAPPPPLDDPRRIRSGAQHYRAHCMACHGAPGVAPQSFAFGMQPAPVNLVPTARHWKPQEVFWVVKHGLRMTGMPAWEYRMSDQEIWDVTAFVMALRGMSPVQFAQLSRELPAHGPHHAQEVPGPGPGQGATRPPRPALRSSWLGDPAAGQRALHQYLCATCHAIPGVVGANRHVGPPLAGMAGRKYIAGILPNNPENMVRWLMDPQRYAPRSAMPNLDLSAQDARDMAAYLYTLDDVK